MYSCKLKTDKAMPTNLTDLAAQDIAFAKALMMKKFRNISGANPLTNIYEKKNEEIICDDEEPPPMLLIMIAEGTFHRIFHNARHSYAGFERVRSIQNAV